MKARYIPVGWAQLKHNRLRFFAAVAGITFAVLLMLVQQGFRAALFDSGIRWHRALDYDLVILSPKTDHLLEMYDISRNRVFQAAGIAGVSAVTPLYAGSARWRNPADPEVVWGIFVTGFDPSHAGFDSVLTDEQRQWLRMPDYYMFDALSRDNYGPILDMLETDGEVTLEVNSRRIRVGGVYEIGTSFGIDGSVVTSDLNFMRLFPEQKKSNVKVGLVQLDSGASATVVRDAIARALPRDVQVLTRDEFMAMEVNYWNTNTPIGYVLNFGVTMGFVVGAIIVYQILFSDVQDHLREYATLKAMGYTNRYLSGVVLQEAAILAVTGFILAILLTWQVFKQAATATNLPLELTPMMGGQVLVLTLLMCFGAGMLALRKVRSADPADVF